MKTTDRIPTSLVLLFETAQDDIRHELDTPRWPCITRNGRHRPTSTRGEQCGQNRAMQQRQKTESV